MYPKEKKVYFFPESFRTFMKGRLLEGNGVLLVGLSGFMLLSLLSYDQTDSSLNVVSSSLHFSNIFAQKGAYLADIIMQYLGKSAFISPVVIGLWGGLFLAHRPVTKLVKRFCVLGGALLLFTLFWGCFSVFFSLSGSPGVFGLVVAKKFYGYFTQWGVPWFELISAGLFLAGFVCCFLYAASLSSNEWRTFFRSLRVVFGTIWGAVTWVWKKWHTYASLKPRVQEDDEEDTPANLGEPDFGEEEPEGSHFIRLEGDQDFEEDITPIQQPSPTYPLTLDKEGHYALPELGLLQSPGKENSVCSVKKAEVEKTTERLMQVLKDFSIKGKICGAKPGPVVTLYEFEPAPGIKASRIIGLADDIARSMSAHSTRIAVVPGKNVLGIELPNSKRQTVFLQELLADSEFENESAKLTLALGKNIGGSPVYADLARMPHMIVAGTTGSGKSVGVNAMILSLLYRHSPETCRFIMIDPKMLEFSMYNGIPHLLSPVVTDPKKAVFALKWTVREMEDRYRAMSHLGVRNIESYNKILKNAVAEGRVLTRQVQTGFDEKTGQPILEEQPIDMHTLPYIVVVVDEMADLMMVAGKEIEIALQRLAQMARAAGIHVIMATQRPSVDVITGTIKANFPTRISFQVTSRFDSRTILGEQGAEQLLGRGDMLFMEAGGRIQRIHGPFVTDEEVECVVRFLKRQGAPNYQDTITEESSDLSIGSFSKDQQGSEGDTLYQQAVAIVQAEQKASTSFVQRRLQIGYNRAARIIEQMENDGIVSVANHVGKRDVLIKKAG